MKVLTILIILLLAFFNSIGQITPFTVGCINDSINYFEFNPPIHKSVSEGSIAYDLDMNNDNIGDFRFKLTHYDDLAGNAGIRYHLRLQPYNENKIAFSHYSLSTDPYGWGNDSIYTAVAKVNSFGDIIDENLDFRDTTLTLYESSSQMESFVIDIDYNEYIAVCITEGGNNTYGWIKMNLPIFTIEAYGLNELPSSIENIIVKDRIIIAPNPANSDINIIPKSNHLGYVSLKLIDYTGKLIESKIINLSNNYRFNLKNEWKGIYIIKIETDNEIITKKIIIE